MAHQRPAPRSAPWLRIPTLRRFIDSYGWRAYAIPVLSVATVLVILQPISSAGGSPSTVRAATPASHTIGDTRRNAQQRPQPARLDPAPTASPSPNTSPPRSVSHQPTVSVCAGNHRAQLIKVSISRQHAWMCAGSRQINASAVTTGEVDNGDATPTGTWEIYAKQTDRYLNGPGYHDYVRYWMPFHGDFGFHDASWQTMPFGDPGYRTHGSHGCVHLPIHAMTWLYQWAQIGATVTITT